jgi:rhodanese-related sulfurtransferase
MDRVLVDVREPFEYMRSHVNGAFNIPLSKLSGETSELSGIPKDAEIILYCNSGNRSGQAVEILRQKGFTNPINGINQQQVLATYQN